MPSDITRVVAFGTYDARQHPRVAILIEGLRSRGVEVVEINEPVWRSTDEKIRAAGSGLAVVRMLAKTLLAWARLARRYRRIGPHDAVLVGYMGQLDVLLARMLVRKRATIVLDLFVSLWDTAVGDRKLIDRRSLKGRMLARLDRWAYKASDIVLFDTEAQRDHFLATFRVSRAKARVVPVGTEPMFSPAPPRASDPDRVRVLFYGLYTPLQGTPVIARAASRLDGSPLRFTMIGDGQERAQAEAAAGDASNITFLDPVAYERLPEIIADHDVVLGVFGEGKGGRVVPNKVFQAAAVGRAIVTARSEAIQAAFDDAVVTVPPADPDALADALARLSEDGPWRAELGARAAKIAAERFSVHAVGGALIEALQPAADVVRASRAWSPPPRYLLRKEIVVPLLDRVKPGGRILEIGVGAGDMSATLGARGYEVVGIDASADAVALARTRVAPYPSVRVELLDLFELRDRFSTERFDGIVAMEVLEHVRDDAAATAILRDLLAPGGCVVVTVPAHPASFDNDDRAVGHYRRYARGEITGLLEAAGFRVESVACYGFPLGNLLKWLRARRTPAPPSDAVPERLSDHSGIRADIPAAIKPLIRRSTMVPFLMLQRAFLGTEMGEGYVVLATVPG